MPEVTVMNDLPDGLQKNAAALYFAAFWGKLEKILGKQRKEDLVTVATPKLRRDRVVTAMAGDQLVGLAAFKRNGDGFADLGFADLSKIYGPIGALWRGLALSFLERTERDGELLMDGICVTETERGRGIGTLLLDAVEAEAQRAGDTSIRLDVIDTNPKARALYERRGFKAVKTRHLGIIGPVFGFSSATEMTKRLEGDP
ncbi:MAG: GNAT family N-acetyltransferase [Pseudomonadota bacterium]